MKAKIIALAAAIIPTALSAQSLTPQEPNDTMVVVNNASKVTVIESRDQKMIFVEGTADDPDFYYSYVNESLPLDSAAVNGPSGEGEWGLSLPFLKEKAKKRVNVVWGNQTYIGIAFPTAAPDGLDQSIEVGMGQFVGLSRKFGKSTEISLGLGFHYQQYALHGHQIFDCQDRRLMIVDCPEAAAKPTSRLRNFGLQIPLTLTRKLAGDFGFAIGAALKLNTFTKATSSYHISDTTYKRDFKGLNQNVIGVDLYAAVGLIDDIGLYVRYTPTKIFSSSNGPRFETISVGVTFGL